MLFCAPQYAHYWCWEIEDFFSDFFWAPATLVEKIRPREGSRRGRQKWRQEARQEGRQEWRQEGWPLAFVAVVVVAVAVAFVVAAWVVVVWVVAAWVVAAWFLPNQKNNA